jgi:hypothetical protein
VTFLTIRVEMTFDRLRHELEATGLIETGKRHR